MVFSNGCKNGLEKLARLKTLKKKKKNNPKTNFGVYTTLSHYAFIPVGVSTKFQAMLKHKDSNFSFITQCHK